MKGSEAPPLVEPPVHPALAPYLVSGPSGFLWVERSSKEGHLRAAPVTISEGEASLRALEMIGVRASLEAWGSVFPATSEGVKEVKEAMHFFHPEELQAFSGENFPPIVQGVMQVPWVPKGTMIIVPKTRKFVGTCYGIAGRWAYVVDNAVAGVAFLTTGEVVPISVP